MKKVHSIRTIEAEDDYLHLVVEGKSYRLRWQDCSPRLAMTTPAQRKHFEVSPAGYGIHWPEIDEDLAITPLVEQAEGRFAPSPHQVSEKKGKYRVK